MIEQGITQQWVRERQRAGLQLEQLKLRLAALEEAPGRQESLTKILILNAQLREALEGLELPAIAEERTS